MSKLRQWHDVEGMPHIQFYQGNYDDPTTLRICWHHVPYSYGTVSYRKLQLLTDGGWKDLLVLKYKDSDESDEVAKENQPKILQRCKDYAGTLYPQVLAA